MRFAVIIAFLYCTCLALSAGDPEYIRDLEAALAGPPAEEAAVSDARPAVPDADAARQGAEPRSRQEDPGRSAFQFSELRARVTARRHTVLSSQSTGRIESIAVRDGDRFHEGAILVRLDDASLRLQRSRAEAALTRQEVLYRMTRELADMQSKGEAEVEVARMEMEQARAELQVVDLLLSRTGVAAPFPGRVADVFVREKQYVAEGTPLLEILDDSTLELEFIVPSAWVRWFGPGYRFDVAIEETGTTHEAVLERLGGKVDPLSQSVKAYAVLVEPGTDLMEGMSGTAHVTPVAGAAD